MRYRCAILALSLSLLVVHASRAAAAEADLVLYDAHVITVDSKFSIASAVAVKGDKIIAVGGPEIAKIYHAPSMIDLHGRTLMPGFEDTHLHPKGKSPRDIDVTSANSMTELQQMLREKAKQLGTGQWITGSGWQEVQFKEDRNISKEDLDAATPDNPVVLVRAGGHSSVGNSMALRLAHIDRNTPDPAGGLIEHEANGEPNGIIRERSDLYLKLVPRDQWADVKQSYVDRLRWLLSLGITSFFDASGTIDDEPVGKGGIANPPPNLTFRRAREIYAEQHYALPRVTMYISYPGHERLEAFGHHTGYGDDFVRIGPIGENVVDGGFTGPTAWLLADYKGRPGFRGKGRFTDAELQAMVDDAARFGWQMGLHAIGDAAIVQTVNAYDRALNSIPGQEHKGRDRRWFTCHFTIMPPAATMATMEKDNIMIAQQPNFEYDLEDRYEETLDPWRLEHNNSVATPHGKYHLLVAFGSDNLPIGPMVGLYAAITRRGRSGEVHGAEEAVSREQAIRMYTAEGAYLSWEENTKGTLEVGKLADMIVLPGDPLTVPAEELLNMKVDMTFVGGKLVYDRGNTPVPDLTAF
jgi:predicted amidohydrolase YtcJ